MARTTPRRMGTSWLQLWNSLRDVPALSNRNPCLTGFMHYRASAAESRAEANAITWVTLDDVSPYLVCAVVRAEDPVFFQHQGIGWARLREAVVEAYKERRGVRGVSTITQQLARNLYLHPERSIRRKLQETVLARRLERVLSKRRILELYLNVVEWGEGLWGIGAAAREYFSKSPPELDAFQSIVLASMLPAPRRPLRDRNAQRALAVQKSLAVDLYGCGILSRAEELAARKRIAYLERAIDAGVPAQQVFRRIAELPNELTLADRPCITTPGVIADECGLERWRHFVLHVRESGRQRRPLGSLPMWWAGNDEQQVTSPRT